MKKTNTISLASIVLTFNLISGLALAVEHRHVHPPVRPNAVGEKLVLSDLELLNELKIPVLEQSEKIGVGMALVSPEEEERLVRRNHEKGRCGGYESLGEGYYEKKGNVRIFSTDKMQAVLTDLEHQVEKSKSHKGLPFRAASTKPDPNIQAAVSDVQANEIEKWVNFLTSFGGRFHASSDPNRHVRELKAKLEPILASVKFPTSVYTVGHNSTQQQSLVVRLEGKSRPNEIVVMGGHLDSINHTMFDNKNNAPGADDNASGSANLIEALRVLLKTGQPERSIEFMWYAAEEVGLNGSNEIARSYKASNKDVIAVLQLDMTLHPGDGELVINSIGDFTHSWLRDLFKELNSLYIGSTIKESNCGYACSDHASWFRQGYPTLFPTESSMNGMNRAIHTRNDVVGPSSSFRHSAQFAKTAVAFAMYLGNSSVRVP